MGRRWRKAKGDREPLAKPWPHMRAAKWFLGTVLVLALVGMTWLDRHDREIGADDPAGNAGLAPAGVRPAAGPTPANPAPPPASEARVPAGLPRLTLDVPNLRLEEMSASFPGRAYSVACESPGTDGMTLVLAVTDLAHASEVSGRFLSIFDQAPPELRPYAEVAARPETPDEGERFYKGEPSSMFVASYLTDRRGREVGWNTTYRGDVMPVNVVHHYMCVARSERDGWAVVAVGAANGEGLNDMVVLALASVRTVFSDAR